MKKIVFFPRILLFTLNALLYPLDYTRASEDTKGQTILLDASTIQGDQLETEQDLNVFQKREDLPALSTALRWEGDDIIELDIPKEILDQLTRPDLSYILGRGSDSEEMD